MRIRLEWKPQDLWIGVFWKRTTLRASRSLLSGLRYDMWICLLPCLPIHIVWGTPMTSRTTAEMRCAHCGSEVSNPVLAWEGDAIFCSRDCRMKQRVGIGQER